MSSPERERILTRKQKRMLANQAREREARRRAIKWIAGSVVAGTTLLVASQCGILETLLGKEELSGEMNQTRELLNKWTQEFKRTPQDKEKYLAKIRDLAIAYFSKQMGYQRERFQNRVEFLNQKQFVEKMTEQGRCGGKEDNPAFTWVLDDKAYVNKEDKRIVQEREPLKYAFVAIVHELIHLSPPRKDHGETIRIKKIDVPVRYEKGLAAFGLPAGSQCSTIFREVLEEAITQDATSRMVLPLGITMSGGHEPVAQIYRREVLKFYGGDHRELLGYHQNSDSEGFFNSIGRKLDPRSQDPYTLANDYLIRFFQSPSN